MKNASILLVVGLLISSCEQLFLGPDEANDPEHNFDLLWNDLDQHYSLFTVRNLNWDSMYQEYRPRVRASTTEEELFNLCSEMIEYLDDSHTSLRSDGDVGFYYSSGYELNLRAQYEEFSEDLMKDVYLEYVKYPIDYRGLYYGKIQGKDIGYIYLASMPRGLDGAVIDNILADIGQHQAIIFDVRNNSGGSTTLPTRLAGAFADETHFVFTNQTRNGPGHDDFGEKIKFYTQPQGTQNYRKPVVVLANRATISAGENFMLYLRAIPSVTLLGDTTAGDFGYRTNDRFLPNGWTYSYSIGKLLLPDGSSLDGIGHVPDVYARNTFSDVYENQQDIVAERAIRYLFEEFGIE